MLWHKLIELTSYNNVAITSGNSYTYYYYSCWISKLLLFYAYKRYEEETVLEKYEPTRPIWYFLFNSSEQQKVLKGLTDD